MFYRPCARQKYTKTFQTYGENYRVQMGQISIRDLHLKQIKNISMLTGSSLSCVVERILIQTMLYCKIDPLEIVRQKAIPFNDKKNQRYKFTISKEIIALCKDLAKKYHTYLSVVIWHIFNLFFEQLCPSPLLLRED